MPLPHYTARALAGDFDTYLCETVAGSGGRVHVVEGGKVIATFADKGEAEGWLYGEPEGHYCDFPLCPCDANQNRLLGESRDFYARDLALARSQGYVGTDADF